jgi:hypothetical protein
MRAFISFAACLAIACSHHGGGGAEPPDAEMQPPMPDAWQIEVDFTGLDRFLDVAAHADHQWHVAGAVTASKGVASLAVNGAAITLGDGGSFAADVKVGDGVTRVPILATDVAGDQRKADRSVIAARFLPEGQPNPSAASLVLTDAIVQAMAAGIVAQAGDVDVASEILAKPTLSSDSQCTTWPTSARQDKTKVTLALSGASLVLHIEVPNLDVTFDGSCQGVIQQIPISGEMQGTIDVTTTLGANAGAPCVTSFTHTAPDVVVNGWLFDVWGTGGPLQDWIVQLFSGQKGPQAEEELQTEVQAKADTLLAQKLANVSVLDTTSQLSLLSKPIGMHLCLGALAPSGSKLVARVAAAATGAGDASAKRPAPGAPMLDGAAVTPAAGELLLDSNLVAQLVFAAWRDGGLAKANVKQIDLGLLTAIARDLRPMFPNGGMADVSIDGELPAVVRAVPTVAGSTADMRVEIGDLMVTISAQGTELFRFGVHLTIDLELDAQGGALVPKVVQTTSEVSLLGEIVDGPDEALEEAVQSQLADSATQLLAGASLTLPNVPGLGTPIDVTPDKGGRWLHVKLK